MLLKVSDAPWKLIGKKRVAIEADDPGLTAGGLVKLTKGARVTAAMIDSVVKCDKNTVSLDRDLRDSIGAEIGQAIRVEALGRVPDAEKARVRASGEMPSAELIKSLLMGSVICAGDRERRIVGGEDLFMTVEGVDPAGPARITAMTAVEVAGAPAEKACRLLPADAENSAGIDMHSELPAQRFTDVGGLEDVKRLLTENVIFPLHRDKAKLYAKMGYRPSRGILLYGPPGTGKTLLARATAGEASASFINVPGSRFKNKWYGESERLIREVFRAAAEAAPCIVFIDEIDAIAYDRSGDHRVNVVNQLLVALDEVRDLDVFVIGATNAIQLIDPALIRPGRLLPVEVSNPDRMAREHIFLIHLKGLGIGRKDMARLVQLTEGYTGARIELACNMARMAAMRESDYSPDTRLEMRHVLAAIDDTSRPEHLSEYI